MQEKERFTSISITTETMIRAVLIGVGVFLIYFLRDLVLIILTSIVIASFVDSAVPRFQKLGMGRVLAAVLMYVVTIFVLAALFYLFAPLLIAEMYDFSTFLSTYIPNSDLINYFRSDAFSGAKDVVTSLSHNFSLANLFVTSRDFISNLSGGFLDTISVAFGSFFNAFLIVIISFYFSVQGNGIENFLRIVVPGKSENYAVDLWNRSRRKIALWVKGQMLLGAIIAILTYLVLSILGTHYALLLALLTGLTERVPYGIIVAMALAVSFAYVSTGFTASLMVLGAYLIIHQFEIYLLYPLIVRKVVGLSPLIVILSILIGFELAGFWGLILAIPVAVSFMEFLNDVEKNKIFARTSHETA